MAERSISRMPLVGSVMRPPLKRPLSASTISLMPARRIRVEQKPSCSMKRLPMVMLSRLRAIGAQQRLDGARIMLSVAVDLDAEIKILTRRIFDAGLHRTADAEILRQAGDGRTAARHGGGRVRRAIVHDQGVVVAAGRRDLAQNAADRGLLVEAGDARGRIRGAAACGAATPLLHVSVKPVPMSATSASPPKSPPCYTCRCFSCTGGGPFPGYAVLSGTYP